MPFPGEYPQPLIRTQTVQFPVVSGYVGSRLRMVDPIRPVISGEETTMMVTFENTGDRGVFLQLRETSDRSVSGTRYSITSGIYVVPKGRSTKTTTGPYQEFLEVYCTDAGPTEIRMQIASIRRWEILGFDKVADSTFYPSSLWQATPVPAASSV